MLLGATGTGKSATTAWLIEQVQRPTLVLAHNKTLAAQLANEFRELLPNNAVEYFVSYYDYYQPEAYVPQTDTFIEKDSLDQRRGRAAAALDDELAAEPSRRRGRLVGLVHLRPRHARGVPRRDDAAAGRPAGRSRLAHPQVRLDAVPAQRRRLLARHVPRARRHDRDHPDLRRARDPHRDVRRRDRGALQPAPADRPGRREARLGAGLPGLALRREHRGDAAGDRHDPHRTRGAARRARARGQAARGAATAHAHHLRPRDDGADRVLLGHRELLAAHRRPAGRARRRTACSTTSPTTSSS